MSDQQTIAAQEKALRFGGAQEQPKQLDTLDRFSESWARLERTIGQLDQVAQDLLEGAPDKMQQEGVTETPAPRVHSVQQVVRSFPEEMDTISERIAGITGRLRSGLLTG